MNKDEFGDVSVHSEERLEKLKENANEIYSRMSKAVLNLDNGITGLAEFSKSIESMAKEFHASSKEYVVALKLIAEENNKVKF